MMELEKQLIQEQGLEEILESVRQVLYSKPIGQPGFNYISPNIKELTGYHTEQFTNEQLEWKDLIYEKDKKKYLKNIEKTMQTANGSFSIDYKINKNDNTLLEVAEYGKFIFDEFGNPVRQVGLIRDNSEIKRAENELCRTQKLQTLGRLAAGVAHEINTPIQFIGDNLQFLQDSFNQYRKALNAYEEFRISGQVEKLKEVLDDVDMDFLTSEVPLALKQSVEGIKRVSGMVMAMRYFSHLDERRMVAADINKAIESTIIILKNEIKYITNIETNLDNNLPKVVCCIDELNQVFMNLVVNAAHSIEQKNQGYNINKGLIKVSSELDGKYVVVKIADNGTGIPEEIQDKIFDSFFTTKKIGKGTGQGLAISHSIVTRKHNGKLCFETQTGKGTTFIVKIPVNPEYKRERREHANKQRHS